MTEDKVSENGLSHAKLGDYEKEKSDWSRSGPKFRNTDRQAEKLMHYFLPIFLHKILY